MDIYFQFSSVYVPKSGIASFYSNTTFNFWGTDELFSKVAMSFYIPISNV